LLFAGRAPPRWREGRSSPVFEDFIGLASMAPVWRWEGHATGRRNATGPSELVATRNAKLIDGSVRRMECEFVECLTGYSLETEFLTEPISLKSKPIATHCFSYVYMYENKCRIKGIFVRSWTETEAECRLLLSLLLIIIIIIIIKCLLT